MKDNKVSQNVDPAEIAHFDALAARWWDPEGEFRPLHDLNPLRTDWINARAPLRGMDVVDIGCGGGILAESMAAAGARVTAIDMGEAPLAVARLHLLESGLAVDYRKCTAEELASAEAGQFDVVTCMEMLEHVPSPSSVIRACHDLLRPGGQVFFATINRNPKAWLLAVVGAEYVLRLLPRGTHEYAKFIKPSELESWARGAGLELSAMSGMKYNPLTRECSLEESVDVNYMMQFRRPA